MTQDAAPTSERGVILANVLSVLALSSAVMVAILTLQDVSIERSTRFMDASTASAYALGGETSAIVALRRDAMEAPETDHAGEAWMAVQQAETAIDGGEFQLTIEDEQGRFNVNNLLTDGLGARSVLDSLLKEIGAPPAAASIIADHVLAAGGLDDLSGLAAAGLAPDLIDRLAEVMCALPESTDINFNSASEPVLQAMLGNRGASRLLVSRRERQGYLTPADLGLARIVSPPRTGFRSDYFRVTTTVTYGTATQTLASRLRRSIVDGQPIVSAWSRQRNAAADRSRPPESE